MVDIRKIIIIFVVAVLFSILVFSTIEAVYPAPKWEDFCPNYAFPKTAPLMQEAKNCVIINVTDTDQQQCAEKKGTIDFIYNSAGCPTSYECNTCQNEFQLANDTHQRYVFYISAVLALLAIFLGLYLPAQKNTLNEWIGTGFMLGGTFALFFGTAQGYISLDRYIRPIVILVELVVVIIIAYRLIGNLRSDKKKR